MAFTYTDITHEASHRPACYAGAPQLHAKTITDSALTNTTYPHQTT